MKKLFSKAFVTRELIVLSVRFMIISSTLSIRNYFRKAEFFVERIYKVPNRSSTEISVKTIRRRNWLVSVHRWTARNNEDRKYRTFRISSERPSQSVTEDLQGSYSSLPFFLSSFWMFLISILRSSRLASVFLAFIVCYLSLSFNLFSNNTRFFL